MNRANQKLDKRPINTNEQKAQSGDEKPGKQRMAGRQIKNVKALRKRGGKGEKQDESGQDEDLSEEGIRPKIKRDGQKRGTREEEETGKGDTGKQTKGKKIKGKNCSYKLYYFLVGGGKQWERRTNEKKME